MLKEQRFEDVAFNGHGNGSAVLLLLLLLSERKYFSAEFATVRLKKRADGRDKSCLESLVGRSIGQAAASDQDDDYDQWI